MPKFRKKPVEVEAEQFTDETKDQVYNWMTGQVAASYEDGKPIIKFKTVHGETAVARFGDWVVKDKKIGTYYPVKDDIFRETYEEIEEE